MAESFGSKRRRSYAPRKKKVRTPLQRQGGSDMRPAQSKIIRICPSKIHPTGINSTRAVPTADGQYEKASLNSSTVTIEHGANAERVSCDRIAQSPITPSGIRVILSDVSQVVVDSYAKTSQ